MAAPPRQPAACCACPPTTSSAAVPQTTWPEKGRSSGFTDELLCRRALVRARPRGHPPLMGTPGGTCQLLLPLQIELRVLVLAVYFRGRCSLDSVAIEH